MPGSSSVSSLTDASLMVRFSVFAILTCLVIESPLRVVSGLRGVGLQALFLALGLSDGELVIFFLALGLAEVGWLFLVVQSALLLVV